MLTPYVVASHKDAPGPNKGRAAEEGVEGECDTGLPGGASYGPFRPPRLPQDLHAGPVRRPVARNSALSEASSTSVACAGHRLAKGVPPPAGGTSVSPLEVRVDSAS